MKELVRPYSTLSLYNHSPIKFNQKVAGSIPEYNTHYKHIHIHTQTYRKLRKEKEQDEGDGGYGGEEREGVEKEYNHRPYLNLLD